MNKKFRALIVDDEPLARSIIRRLLDEIPDVEIIGEASNGLEAVVMLDKHNPDLVFLDVQMPEMDGFAALEAIEPEKLPVVIFVTAFDQYALRAFDAHAVDYLLKPFDDERFTKAVTRAKIQINGKNSGDAEQTGQQLLDLLKIINAKNSFLERFVVKNVGRVLLVKASDVDWIEAQDNYVSLHVGKTAHLIRETMQNLETRLDPNRFARIHRSTIVNIDSIKELHFDFNGDQTVLLKDGQKLILSRRYRQKLSDILGSNI
ncbi:MAG: response regulator transcription factor [Pyrinomonadaceae bacterium]|nr:response regulator transcription factor [Pyrinomonadaceae bacterium]